MREVDESLELMKKDYKNRMDVCEERRQQFILKQAKMRDFVLKYEKFIQENDAKRQRAEMKSKSEEKLYKEKTKEITILEERIQKLQLEQNELHNDLSKSNKIKTAILKLLLFLFLLVFIVMNIILFICSLLLLMLFY
jgi:Flp pilus assembly protein TadB